MWSFPLNHAMCVCVVLVRVGGEWRNAVVFTPTNRFHKDDRKRKWIKKVPSQPESRIYVEDMSDRRWITAQSCSIDEGLFYTQAFAMLTKCKPFVDPLTLSFVSKDNYAALPFLLFFSIIFISSKHSIDRILLLTRHHSNGSRRLYLVGFYRIPLILTLF